MSNKVELICIGLWVISLTTTVANAKTRSTFVLDRSLVCTIKRSCVECLRLDHCSWCESENRCFSKELPKFEGFCKNDTIDYVDQGFSLKENAECACGSSTIKNNCHPPDVEEGEVCSGRGNCVCGRCICDSNPDPEHPTKQVVGDYCEFDNFSCDGPHCNEGPYLLSQAKTTKDNSNGVDEPAEI